MENETSTYEWLSQNFNDIKKMATLAGRKVGVWESDLEDFVSDCLLRLVKCPSDEAVFRESKGFLYVVIVGLARNFRRKSLRARARYQEFENMEPESTTTTPYDLVVQIEESAKLQELIDLLPHTYGQIIKLHTENGLSLTEIADVMGLKYNHAKQLFKRAKDALVALGGLTKDHEVVLSSFTLLRT